MFDDKRFSFSPSFRALLSRHDLENLSEEQLTKLFWALGPFSLPSFSTAVDISEIISDDNLTLPPLLDQLLCSTFTLLFEHYLDILECAKPYTLLKNEKLRKPLFSYCIDDSRSSGPLLGLQALLLLEEYSPVDFAYYPYDTNEIFRSLLEFYLEKHSPAPKDLDTIYADLSIGLQRIVDNYLAQLHKDYVGDASTLEALENLPGSRNYFCYGGVFEKHYQKLVLEQLASIASEEDVLRREAELINARPYWARELVARLASS